ncbi:unnamed protein product [Vitrella brassicaformis CCMP3155]|uniref:Uncharacterized protein n=1 Tax=Vitrella brassicaformis (strain CCMP3155) TaxID=1169540 RepID=A0A0G4FNS3_VITBC|nr:unnamed protein product [Vitrella brassicaformis CCMP3155]|eukprot:CEM15872.1 unnamed protein product [Vitrella brassicaformis CCMP3155]
MESALRRPSFLAPLPVCSMLHSEARRVLRHPTATVTDDLFMASVDQLFVPVRKVWVSAALQRAERGG